MPERVVTSRHTARVGGKVYDVHRLIDAAENLPVETVPISIFAEHVEEDACWTDKKGNRLGPKHIIALAEKYNGNIEAMRLANPDWEEHVTTMEHADYTAYPLLVSGGNNVVDGMHRLTRAWLDKAAEITIRRFEKLPEQAEIPDKK